MASAQPPTNLPAAPTSIDTELRVCGLRCPTSPSTLPTHPLIPSHLKPSRDLSHSFCMIACHPPHLADSASAQSPGGRSPEMQEPGVALLRCGACRAPAGCRCGGRCDAGPLWEGFGTQHGGRLLASSRDTLGRHLAAAVVLLPRHRCSVLLRRLAGRATCAGLPRAAWLRGPVCGAAQQPGSFHRVGKGNQGGRRPLCGGRAHAAIAATGVLRASHRRRLPAQQQQADGTAKRTRGAPPLGVATALAAVAAEAGLRSKRVAHMRSRSAIRIGRRPAGPRRRAIVSRRTPRPPAVVDGITVLNVCAAARRIWWP
eukprot:351277-Chlamydomonas_euryale.AAC.2